MKPSEATKAIGVAISGVLSWAAVVVASPAHAITASEWLALGGVGAMTAACFGLTNSSPAPSPVPPPPSPPPSAPAPPA